MMQIQGSHSIMFGNILLLQTMLILRKTGPKMLSVCYVTKASVDESSSTYLKARHAQGRARARHASGKARHRLLILATCP